MGTGKLDAKPEKPDAAVTDANAEESVATAEASAETAATDGTATANPPADVKKKKKFGKKN